jgi:hypothetical protein
MEFVLLASSLGKSDVIISFCFIGDAWVWEIERRFLIASSMIFVLCFLLLMALTWAIVTHMPPLPDVVMKKVLILTPAPSPTEHYPP